MSKQSSIRTQIGFLTHRISGKAFPVSDKLATCLVETLASHITLKAEVLESLLSARRVVFNFRDKNYSAERGDFHAVEICLLQSFDGDWQYQYATDFAYIGNYYPELEKALDFDFHSCQFKRQENNLTGFVYSFVDFMKLSNFMLEMCDLI